jgi:hypothetical protein
MTSDSRQRIPTQKVMKKTEEDEEEEVEEDGGWASNEALVTEPFAFALSGGGIRSASFSYGVLKHLLHVKKLKPEAFCCCSGGGYTGSAFVQNVIHYMKHEDISYDDAVAKFFSPNANLPRNYAYLVSYRNVLRGIAETALALLYVTFWWWTYFFTLLPRMFLIALLIDQIFGDALRVENFGTAMSTVYITLASVIVLLALVWAFLPTKKVPTVKEKIEKDEAEAKNTQVHSNDASHTAVDVGGDSGSGSSKQNNYAKKTEKTRRKLTFTSRLHNVLSIALVGLLFILVLLLLINLSEELRRRSDNNKADAILQASLLIFVVAIIRPLFNKATSSAVGLFSLAIYIILMTRITQWRVYKDIELLWGIPYTQTTWNGLFLATAIALYLPLEVMFWQLTHFYYRWRLQKAFYEHTGFAGCAGMLDQFACGGEITKMRDLSYPGVPKYFGLTVLNGWKKDGLWVSSDQIATVESGGMMRVLPRVKENDPFWVDMGHLDLSDVMAMSGAAVAYRMGEINNSAFRYWQVHLGAGLGRWIYTREHKAWVSWSFIIAGHIVTGTLCMLVLYVGLSSIYLLIPLGFLGISVLALIMLPPEWRLLQWMYHLPFTLELFSQFGIDVIGGDPLPPRVFLSDGSHIETLGLIPLLEKRRYRTIIICDGSQDVPESCETLTLHLDMARKLLGCSFFPQEKETNQDMEAVLREFAADHNASALTFWVHYDDSTQADEGSLKKSEIIYLKPRLGYALNNSEMHMEEYKNEHMHGCCCECCHQKACSCLDAQCATFPQHSTGNQFFTGTMFRQYYKLGYEVSKSRFSNLKTPVNSITTPSTVTALP